MGDPSQSYPASEASFVLVPNRPHHREVLHVDPLDDLRQQLSSIDEIASFRLEPGNYETVVAKVPASNRRQMNALRHIIAGRLTGWSIYEPSSLSLPRSW